MIDIIIVSHNNSKFLDACLSSIFLSTKLPINPLVIINNQKDIESLKIAKKYSVKIFVNKKEKGLAANLNQGIRMTKGEFILILNPDVMLQKRVLENLILFMKKHHKAAVCGPKLIYPDGRLQLSARHFPTWKTFLIRRSPVRRFLTNSKLNKHHLGMDLDHNKVQPVDWILGAFMLIRRKALEEIGFFDEKYYLYVEDIDFCFRVWKKDWQVWYVPQSCVIHYYQAKSDKEFFSIYNWYHFKGMWRFFLKNILKILK